MVVLGKSNIFHSLLISGVIHPVPNGPLWGKLKKKLLGPDSKQEHSWDMFKIGQTAPHSKVDIYSSFDFQRYVKVRWKKKLRVMTVGNKVITHNVLIH